MRLARGRPIPCMQSQAQTSVSALMSQRWCCVFSPNSRCESSHSRRENMTPSDHSSEHPEHDVTWADAGRQRLKHVVCSTSQRHHASCGCKRGSQKGFSLQAHNLDCTKNDNLSLIFIHSFAFFHSKFVPWRKCTTTSSCQQSQTEFL